MSGPARLHRGRISAALLLSVVLIAPVSAISGSILGATLQFAPAELARGEIRSAGSTGTTTSTALAWYAVGEPWAPTAQYGASMAYDAADGTTVLFGGCAPSGLYGFFCGATNTTAVLRAGYWTQLNSTVHPPARYNAAMAYDPVDRYVLLFGGARNGYGSYNDTWSYSNGNWTNQTTSIAPPPSGGSFGGAGLVYDATMGEMVYYGGNCGTTWTYLSGVWSQVNTTGQPCPSVAAVSMAYDNVDGYALLFGGSILGLPIGTWSFTDGVWANISGTLSAQPPPTIGATMAYDPLDQEVILYGGSSASIFPTYFTNTWTYSGGVWTNVSAVAGVGASPTFGSAAFDVGEGDLVYYGGHGLGGNGAGTFDFGEPLLQASWATKTPFRATAGGSVDVSVAVSGGAGIISAQLSGDPSGCTASGVPPGPFNFTCATGSAGRFDVNATVNDSRAKGVRLEEEPVVVSPGSPGTSGNSVQNFLSNPLDLAFLALAGVAVALGIVVALGGRAKGRRRGRVPPGAPTPVETEGTPGPEPPAEPESGPPS